MLQYMLDTDICIYVIKSYPPKLRGRFNRLAEQLCISSITLAELHFGAEKSVRRLENLLAVEHFAARLDVLAFSAKAAVHYGQIRADLERGGTPAGPHDILIGAHGTGRRVDRCYRKYSRVQAHAWRSRGDLDLMIVRGIGSARTKSRPRMRRKGWLGD